MPSYNYKKLILKSNELKIYLEKASLKLKIYLKKLTSTKKVENCKLKKLLKKSKPKWIKNYKI